MSLIGLGFGLLERCCIGLLLSALFVLLFHWWHFFDGKAYHKLRSIQRIHRVTYASLVQLVHQQSACGFAHKAGTECPGGSGGLWVPRTGIPDGGARTPSSQTLRQETDKGFIRVPVKAVSGKPVIKEPHLPTQLSAGADKNNKIGHVPGITDTWQGGKRGVHLRQMKSCQQRA